MNIEQKVKDIIVQQLGVDPEKVKPEASFVEDPWVPTRWTPWSS